MTARVSPKAAKARRARVSIGPVEAALVSTLLKEDIRMLKQQAERHTDIDLSGCIDTAVKLRAKMAAFLAEWGVSLD